MKALVTDKPGQYGMVVPRFINRALKNEPILIYGTGQQTRCFGYVGDTLDVVVELMNHPDAPGKVYNIGSTELFGISSHQ